MIALHQWILGLFCVWMMPVQATLSSEWAYSQACCAAQKGAWKDAQEAMRSVLVDEPDRPDLLYDAGVAAYKLKEFEKADAYFSSVIDQNDGASELQKRAYFNQGNTKVALQKLEDAVAAYEKALAIDPNDQKIRHNRDIVKEMLEQQKQEQKQQDQQQQNQQQQDQDKQDQQSQDNTQDNQQNDSQNQQKNSNGDSDQKNKGQENKQEGSSEAEQEKHQDANDKQDGQHDNEVGNKADSKQSDDKKNQFSDDHAPSSQDTTHQKHKNDASQDIKRDAKEQEMQAGQEDPGDYRQEELSAIEKKLPEHQKWMARALQQLEKAEEQEQKKLIKVQTRKQVVEHDEQNCW